MAMTTRPGSVRALIIVESMFGATISVAEAIAQGMAAHASVSLQSVTKADSDVRGHDLVVVGGPTHSHGMSTALSRERARILSLESADELQLDEDSAGIGVREWLERVRPNRLPRLCAAFDTRVRGMRILTGAASEQIDEGLRERGSAAVVPPMSFLVAPDHKLIDGELGRAREWGEQLASEAAIKLPG